MKKIYLLLFTLITSSCCPFENSHCLNDSRRDYKYGDKAKVTNGFFKGHMGTIIAQTWVNDNGCGVHGFVLNIWDNNVGQSADVKVSQYDLFVE